MRKGQALLVVLLILGVVMTVGLSVVSRSVTEVSISTTQEESTRALEAAEAGIEKSLAGVGNFGDPAGDSVTFSNNSIAQVVNPDIAGTTNEYVVPYDLVPGDVANINLVGFAGSGFRVCWGNDDVVNPTTEIMLYTSSGAVTNMRRWVLGPAPFQTPQHYNGCPGMKGDGVRWVSLTKNNDFNNETPLALRIRLFGVGTPQVLAVRSVGGNLPVQGKNTLSTGMSGGTSKKVRVIQLNPDMPYMFDSALFSGGALVK